MNDFTPDELETVTRSIATTDLWTGHCYESEFDDNPVPLDELLNVDDLPADVMADLRTLAEDFIAYAREDDRTSAALDTYLGTLTLDRLGHDISLTTCGHGAGFWDRDLGDAGEALTDVARAFRREGLSGYRDDDGNVIVTSA